MREKSQENAALQLKLLEISREIEAAKEGACGSASELQSLKSEFNKYRAEAEEAIKALVEEEERSRLHLQRLQASTAAGSRDAQHLPAGKRADAKAAAHALAGSAGVPGSAGAGDVYTDAALRGHVAALRHAGALARSRKAAASMLRELPPLPCQQFAQQIGAHTGPRTSGGGQDGGHAARCAECTTNLESTSGECTTNLESRERGGHSATDSSAGGGGGGWEKKERGRRERLAAVNEELEALQLRVLTVSLTPLIASVAPTAQSICRGGARDARQLCAWAEVRSCMQHISRTAKGLDTVPTLDLSSSRQMSASS